MPGKPLKVEFTKKALSNLEKLSTEIASRVISKIEWLASNSDVTVLALTGLPDHLNGLLKYRVGSYRILFWLTEDSIVIYRIGHRSEIYKNLD